jgi:ABC-type sulfate transport system permease component
VSVSAVLIGVLVTLIFMDAVTTAAAVPAGAREKNPRLRWFMKVLGVERALLLTHSTLIAVTVCLGPACHPVVLTALALLFARAAFTNARNAHWI